jgi:putative alpha-1,2-mannosidase
MTLHSPVEFAQIVDTYIDGWRKLGWMPECRANHLPGWTQGGSSGDNIVAQFAVNYHDDAEALGVDLNELYAAMVTDGEVNPPEWNTMGRQVNVYKYVIPHRNVSAVLNEIQTIRICSVCSS